MADPLSEYNKQMMARGLGGALQGEYANPYGMFSGPPKTKLGDITRGILGGIESGGEFLQYLTSPREGGLPKKVTDNVVEYLGSPSEYIKEEKKQSPEYLGEFGGLNKPPKLSEQEMANILSDVETKADDKFDLFKKLSKLDVNFVDPSLAEAKKDEKVTRKYGDASAAEEFRAKEAQIANLTGARITDNVAPEKPKDDEIKDLFMSGVDEYMKVLGREVPPEINREEALKKYKDEFSEATGIDISGKPDTSAALMSLGLALMQNRAGSGFNVGRILSEAGKAGEKALPMFQEAKKEAKAATAAAGKYALQMIKSDEDARDAIKASNASIKQELILKNIDAQNSIKEKILEARLEGKELSVPESIYEEKIKIGTNEYNIRMGIEPSTLNSVFVNPVRDVDEVASAYKKTVSGIDAIEKMEDLTQELMNISEGQPGGLTTVRFLDKAQGVLKSMGLSQDSFFSEEEARNLSIESEIDAVRRAFIMRFKRFISQETGNGISNVDVKQIQEAAGQLDGLLQFTNPEQSLVAFGELRQLFNDSLNSLDPIIDDFGDRRNYYEGSEGDELYNRTLEKLSTTFGQGNNLFMPTVVENADGSQSITYDVRSG
tara:strand:+ start:41 stop:1855 length:1815 start_codon:yes stop_codon:yes gene_type:complete